MCQGTSSSSTTTASTASPPPTKMGEDSRDIIIERKHYNNGRDYLNSLVKKKTEAAVIDPKDPESQCYVEVKNGALIYPYRSRLVLYTSWALVAFNIYRSPSILFTVLAFLYTTPFIDLYGGILHIVLDEPAFIPYPIIGRGCLEFQWHHILPYDITVRSFSDIAGDLNQLAPLFWVMAFLVYNPYNVPDPQERAKGMAVAGVGVFNAYLGQFSHRMAHFVSTERPWWTNALQKVGLLVDPETHRDHHRYYQDGFPILNGMTSPLLTWAKRNIPYKHFWLFLFVFFSLFLLPFMIITYIQLFDYHFEA